MNKYPDQFNNIMEEVFEQEGGFTYDDDDPGGATKYGVTLSTMRRLSIDLDNDDDIDIDDVKLLSKPKAKETYWNSYWKKTKISKYPIYLKLILFDMSVNFGNGGAIRVLQKSINNKLGKHILKEDGISGKNTIEKSISSNVEVKRVQTYRIYRFCKIAYKNKDLEKFLHGWIKRARRIG